MTYPITNRDPEFIDTITALYLEVLERAPDPSGLHSFLHLAQWGWTGDQIRQTLLGSQEYKELQARKAEAARSVLPLVATPTGFQTPDGTPYTWAQVDCWRAKEKVQQGQDIRGVLDEALEVGANGVRVVDDTAWYDTHSAPDVSRSLDAIARLGELLKARQLRGQYCVFADWQQCWGGDLRRARDYAAQVYTVLRRYPGWIVQLVNEGNQHGQNFPFDAFDLPEDLLCSRGSQGTGDNPPMPLERASYRYHDLGSERRFGKLPLSTTTVFYAINGYEGEGTNPGFPGTQWPTVVSEPPGIGDGAARYGDPAGCFLMGLGTRFDPQGRACGGTAHADDCLQTVPMQPLTKACVTAFLAGVKAGRR